MSALRMTRRFAWKAAGSPGYKRSGPDSKPKPFCGRMTRWEREQAAEKRKSKKAA